MVVDVFLFKMNGICVGMDMFEDGIGVLFVSYLDFEKVSIV